VVAGGGSEEGRPRAQGSPAPLTQEQVHALARGVADEAEIARILEAHLPAEKTEPARAPRKRSPVRISADELATLRERGRTPKVVAERLKEAERKDRGTVADRAEQEQPSERPPRTPRRSG
jgi:hypothetical protein